MRWPVSAEVVDHFQRQLEQADERLRAANARYDALLEKYHDLKASGAAPTAKPAERPDDPVTNAILAKAKGHPILFRHFQTYVAERRALGVSEEEIAKAILRGQSDQDEESLA